MTNIEQFIKHEVKYYKKSLKSQPKNQDDRYINYLAGKYHAYQTIMLILKENRN